MSGASAVQVEPLETLTGTGTQTHFRKRYRTC
ncbi:hypothetical protein SAMN04489807_2162 [Microbacterium hydrocarbonoxydans]|uniref:Uncharacterized protein n=1 Tax=Microbacterium hydrocarbonoxydans TaxID=273678 RepID=A0A1H4MKV4_9MICO|nr:hypothetical protein SAMN04489807_2162 [Microbacterium hydrocarbonoxydans]